MFTFTINYDNKIYSFNSNCADKLKAFNEVILRRKKEIIDNLKLYFWYGTIEIKTPPGSSSRLVK